MQVLGIKDDLIVIVRRVKVYDSVEVRLEHISSNLLKDVSYVRFRGAELALDYVNDDFSIPIVLNNIGELPEISSASIVKCVDLVDRLLVFIKVEDDTISDEISLILKDK